MAANIENAIYPQITTVGLAAVTSAVLNGQSVEITHLAVGGASYTAIETRESLDAQIGTLIPVTDGQVLDDHQIHVVTQVPHDHKLDGDGNIEEYWIREVGFYITVDNQPTPILLAAYSDPDPETAIAFKAKGSGLLLSFDLKLSSLAAGSVTINGTGQLAFNAATAEVPGLVTLATSMEALQGVDDKKAITAKTLAASRYGLNSIDGSQKDVLSVDASANVQIQGDVFLGDQWYTDAGKQVLGPKNYPAGAVIGDKIYMLGGQFRHSDGSIAGIDEYDTISNQWQRKTSMTYLRRRAQAVAVGNVLYFLGGIMDHRYDTAVNHNEQYDSASDSWETKAAMPGSRWFMGASEVAGVIYIIGGIDEESQDSHTVFSYIVAEDRWESSDDGVLAPMPQDLDGRGVGSAVVNSKIYVFSGYKSYEYDPAENIWVKKSDIPRDRGRGSCVALNNEIYFFDGHPEMDVYRPETDTWRRAQDIPLPRTTVGLAVDGKIYMVAGHGSSEYFYQGTALDIQIYHPGNVCLDEHIRHVVASSRNLKIVDRLDLASDLMLQGNFYGKTTGFSFTPLDSAGESHSISIGDGQIEWVDWFSFRFKHHPRHTDPWVRAGSQMHSTGYGASAMLRLRLVVNAPGIGDVVVGDRRFNHTSDISYEMTEWWQIKQAWITRDNGYVGDVRIKVQVKSHQDLGNDGSNNIHYYYRGFNLSVAHLPTRS